MKFFKQTLVISILCLLLKNMHITKNAYFLIFNYTKRISSYMNERCYFDNDRCFIITYIYIPNIMSKKSFFFTLIGKCFKQHFFFFLYKFIPLIYNDSCVGYIFWKARYRYFFLSLNIKISLIFYRKKIMLIKFSYF